jgi:2-(1,2-epoxy-1,2-dihydrophenyl)acetyl-CoA isomerase
VTDLHVQIDDHVATVEIRRPPANYFDEPLIEALADTYEMLDRDYFCRAIVLCSEGKHFCAGANFTRDDQRDADDDDVARFYSQALRLFSTETPVVAAVQGAAIGGGFGLALSADFRVGGAGSRFAANFSRLGFHPGFGISVTLPPIVGQQKALDYLLTGRQVCGDEAFRAGLLDDLVSDADIRTAATQFANRIASSAPLAVTSIRKTMRQGVCERVVKAIEREHEEQTRLRATADFAEGIAASTQRRNPVFVGR